MFGSRSCSNFEAFGAGFALKVAWIYSAIWVSILVTPHMSASLTNLMVVAMYFFNVDSLKRTQPRYSHCTSISKLRGKTMPSISAKVVDRFSPSRNSPLNVAAKYWDCRQRRVFESSYSWLADLIRTLTRGGHSL